MQPIQRFFASTPVCLIFIFLTTTGFGFLETDFRDASRRVRDSRDFPNRYSIDNPPFRRETIRQKDRIYENLYDRRSFRTGTYRQPSERSTNALERDSRSGSIRENVRFNDNRERFFQERSRSLQDDRTRVRSSEMIRDLQFRLQSLNRARQAREAHRTRLISVSNDRSSLDERSRRTGESRENRESRRNMESRRNVEIMRNMESRRNVESMRSRESMRNVENRRNMETRRIVEIRRNVEPPAYRARSTRTIDSDRLVREDRRQRSTRIEAPIRFAERRMRFADNSERERSISRSNVENRDRTVDSRRFRESPSRVQASSNSRTPRFLSRNGGLSGEGGALSRRSLERETLSGDLVRSRSISDASNYMEKEVDGSSNFNACINVIQVLLGAYLVGQLVARSSKKRGFEFQNLLPFASMKQKVE
ncbi:unnamed protein product [Phyllotreta striolata]|uniref:Uncharacterized protein n=1 Tax=Phyllotreta striolata TaxID=444603 RepID=A0A9N9TQA5_PHYSR|nr:unnamed protein product [Phyllotreta striolata]